jgi:hypothetical protein
MYGCWPPRTSRYRSLIRIPGSTATSGRDSGIVDYNVQVAVATGRSSRVVADQGYFSSAEIRAREETGIAVTLPKPMTSNARPIGGQAGLPLRG